MIRAAQSDDARWITALWNAVIENTDITFTTTLKTEAQIDKAIATGPMLVLPDQGGFATFGPFRPGPGYAATVEHTIHLHPRARGQGHGRALLTALQARALDQGHHVMVAGISGTNTNAVAFHTRMGFKTVGRMSEVGRKNGTWLDLVLMQKHLGATASANANQESRV